MNELKLKFKKLHPNAVIPQYSREGDGALDLIAVSKKGSGPSSQIEELRKNQDSSWYPPPHLSDEYIEMGTGLAVEIPKGYVGLIFPRSSISRTKSLLNNAVGVIDSNYRGEITFRFKPIPFSLNPEYDIGERIGQLLVIPIPRLIPIEVMELSETNRGIGAWGSSGK